MDITWPALLRLHGDAELTVVRDLNEWERDPHLHAAHYLPEDRLIDAAGNLYFLQAEGSKRRMPVAVGQRVALDDVIALVQAHAAQAGACCVAKFSADSIVEAIEAVGGADCPVRR